MSYERKEWKIKDFQKGDQALVDSLNHMEEGIEEGGGGGGGEPSKYIKEAVVANEKLTLTKKDGSLVELDVSGKQAAISDLADIRDGAAKGKTAIQSHQSLAEYRKSADQDAIDNGTKARVSTIENDYLKSTDKVELATYIANKVDKPAEPVEGQGVNVPYYFEVSYDADKAVVKDYTIDLLNKAKTPQQFSLNINAADSSKAGLLAAADKIKLDNLDKVKKNWINLTVSEDEVEALLSNGERLVKKLSTPYAPGENRENFVRDYYRVDLDNSANLVGKNIKPGMELKKIYADFTTPSGGKADWLKPEVYKVLNEMRWNYGFDYHYYRTVMLYAGCTDPENLIISADNAFDAQNVVYIQDISQQPWEKNSEDGSSSYDNREKLESETFDLTYVLSIKGGTAADNIALMFNYEDTQAAYWNSTAGAIKWKDIEAGKVYKCTFDSEHDTERWLLDLDANGDPIEFTETELVNLQQNGISFGSGLYAAEIIEDTVQKQKGQLCGCFYDIIKLISINTAFSQEELFNLDIIARPAGFIPYYVDWYDEETGEWVYEEDGVYLWHFEASGVVISILIPKNHLSIMLIEPDNDSSGSAIAYNYNTLFRHTFTVNNNDYASEVGDYKCNISFCAVNSQMGDTGADYLLYSDDNGNIPRWILPASGVVGKITGTKINPTGTLTKLYLNADYTAAKICDLWDSFAYGSQEYTAFQASGTHALTDNSLIKLYKYAAEGDSDIYGYFTAKELTEANADLWFDLVNGTNWRRNESGNWEQITGTIEIEFDPALTGVSGVGDYNEVLRDLFSFNETFKFDKWYQAYRVLASYDNDNNSVIKIQYINDDGTRGTADVIKEATKYKYDVVNFRSEIGSYIN